MKILITSFGRFGRYKANSSEIVAKALARKGRLGSCWVVCETFPADIPSYDRGRAVLDLASQEEADAIVMLGMASDRYGLCIEPRAVNRIFHPVYCPSEINDTPVDKNLELGHELQDDIEWWNPEYFVNSANISGIRVLWSVDAGGFCCNHLLFQVLMARRTDPERYGRIPSIFIHLPCTPETLPETKDAFRAEGKVVMEIDGIIQGLEILVRFPSSQHSAIARSH